MSQVVFILVAWWAWWAIRCSPGVIMLETIIPRRRKKMRFRVRTIMVAVVIVGLVMALTVLWWRAREEIRRANIEVAGTRIVNSQVGLALGLAEARARSAEQRAIAAEARAELLELQAKAVRDLDGDQNVRSPVGGNSSSRFCFE